MEKELKELYGSYSIPKEVRQLIKLEENLQKDGLSHDMVGLIKLVESYSYSLAPPDFIPFAQTGGDGIHFGFFTDFNKVSGFNECTYHLSNSYQIIPNQIFSREFQGVY